MSEELQSLIVLVSALSGALSVTAGLIYYALLLRFSKLVKNTTGESIPKNIGILSLISAAFSIGIGMFLLYRMGIVATTGEDFSSRDWVVYHLLVGCNLFTIALRGIETFKYRMGQMLGRDPKQIRVFDSSMADE